MAFTRAKRTKVPLKLAVTGPTGSGKTYSALLLAKGLADGGTIAVLDTENESASLYDEVTEFDVQNIYAPFTVQKFAEGIKEAEQGGYAVLIIDSLSHAWAANGGILSQKEAKDAQGGNSYTNWAAATKQYENLKRVILESPLHIICCMRTKMNYEQKKNDAGKTTVEKIGMAPVMRDGMEYEFTVLLDVDADHSAWASKDRTGVFEGMVEPISEKHGKMLVEWQRNAPPAPAYVPTPERQQEDDDPAGNADSEPQEAKPTPKPSRATNTPPPAKTPPEKAKPADCERLAQAYFELGYQVDWDTEAGLTIEDWQARKAAILDEYKELLARKKADLEKAAVEKAAAEAVADPI